MIAFEKHPQGVIIPVRVRAGARRTGVAGTHDGALRIEVTAAPEKGKANTAVAEVLAEVLGVPKTSVELVSGATNPQKRFLVAGMAVATARARINEKSAS